LIASSSTVLANLAYLIGAVVFAVIGGLVVWLRHRQPRSVDANMATFRRGLSALAPDPRPQPAAVSGEARPRVRATPTGLTHVRVNQDRPAPGAWPPEVGALPDSAAEEAVDEQVDGESG
jgi:hypothetical protein